jgi:hypothetical protein
MRHDAEKPAAAEAGRAETEECKPMLVHDAVGAQTPFAHRSETVSNRKKEYCCVADHQNVT